MNPKFRTCPPGRLCDQHHLELVERAKREVIFILLTARPNLLLQHAHFVRCAHGRQQCMFKLVARIYPGCKHRIALLPQTVAVAWSLKHGLDVTWRFFHVFNVNVSSGWGLDRTVPRRWSDIVNGPSDAQFDSARGVPLRLDSEQSKSCHSYPWHSRTIRTKTFSFLTSGDIYIHGCNTIREIGNSIVLFKKWKYLLRW